MRSLFTGFKDFIMRGNVVELAIAVVIGTAFTALVNGLVEGLLNPLVALVAGRNDLSQVGAFEVAGTPFRPGLAIDALITFLLVAAAVYFFIKMPLTTLARLRERDEAEAAAAAPLEPADVVLLREIRDLLTQQATTTARVGGAGSAAGVGGAGGEEPTPASDRAPRHAG
ncbi:large conductance mechanosensitive channel protein MscL [Cellulomonas aerilata]|uniref:Large-conductance mechanosensitive channel n=1 Tax=Cellulomonas aerilata TaxID=515326 RepID=A0A512DDQ6_9CELL|nr:large conductance mechanosensitive channel protein MscL [Cellulomonas aerilata]GEO34604.1 large-conductance mechanosensitive channel [Cellulomonas aerilata]